MMNKDELINILRDEIQQIETVQGKTKPNLHFCRGNLQGRNHAYNKVIKLLQKMDAPTKPTLPKFMDDFIEKHSKWVADYIKINENLAASTPELVFMAMGRTLFDACVVPKPVFDWLTNPDHQIILYDALKYGYDVEEQYIVRITDKNRHHKVVWQTNNGFALRPDDCFEVDDVFYYQFNKETAKLLSQLYHGAVLPAENPDAVTIGIINASGICLTQTPEHYIVTPDNDVPTIAVVFDANNGEDEYYFATIKKNTDIAERNFRFDLDKARLLAKLFNGQIMCFKPVI